MIPKVFVIVYKIIDENYRFLLLKPAPEPGRDIDYYVITGGVEVGEIPQAAAKREVEEEIGTKPGHMLGLNHALTYRDSIDGQQYVEYCFAARIGNEALRLNEEHLDYKWVSAKDFVRFIWWEDDRTELRHMVSSILHQ